MINLIPSVVKKVIIRDYRVRVLSVFFFILSVVSIVIGFLFLPVYVLVSTQVNVYAKSAADAALEVADYASSTKILANANQMSQQIIQLRSADSFAATIKLIEANLGAGIKIELIELSRTAGDIAPIRVNGMADTRQNLSQFRDRLLALPEIEDVVLPLSNLAKDKDIQFTISVVLSKKN